MSTLRAAGPQERLERFRDIPVFAWLFLAALLVTVLSGNARYLGLPIGPDRLLFPAALALLIFDPRRDRLRWLGVYALMALLVGWTAWSALTHGTLLQAHGLFALLDRVALPFVLFAAAPLVFATSRRRDLLLQALVLLGLYLGVTAIFEIIGPRSLVFPRFILDPSLGLHWERARGPFLSGEANGMALAITVFAAGALLTRRRGLWALACVATIVVGTLGCALTMTRSAWLALLLGMLAAAVLAPPVRLWLAGAFVGSALLATGFLLMPRVGQDLFLRLTTQGSLDDRYNTNEAGLRILAAKPLDGVGWMIFESHAYQWVRQADNYPVTTTTIEIHNVFLARAAELGILAAVLYGLCVLFGPVQAVWRAPAPGDLATWRVLAVACAFVWLVPTLMSPNPYPFPNFVVWVIAGVAGRHYLIAEPPDPPVRSRDSGAVAEADDLQPIPRESG